MKYATNLVIISLMVVSCGGGGGTEQDTTTADTTPDTAVDTVTDTPVDSTADTSVDTTPDTVIDTAVDTASDVTGDTSTDATPDAEEDTSEDGSTDVLGDDVTDDAVTACELDGGYCTTYAVVADPCVTCASVGATDYAPARSSAGAMECTASGDGAAAWCCLPLDATDPPECQTAGGACYSGGGPVDPCPVGWDEDVAHACPGGRTCCAPGASC